MSWDLYLVPPEHADDPDEWLESIAEAGSDSEVARRHGDAILAQRPDLRLEGPFDDGGCQLLESDELSPLTIDLDGHSATINVAYWDLGSRTAEVADLLADVVRALEREAGFVAFDPQEDRVVAADEVRELFERWHPQGVATAERMRHELEAEADSSGRGLLARLRRLF